MVAIEKLGFIGVGVMGGRMCRNLAVKSGLPVTAYDTDAERVGALAGAGVKPAASVGEVVGAADAVLLCLPGEPQVRAVGLGPGGLAEHARAGQTFVDMTTATVAVDRELAERLAARGADFADAPVARGVPSAQDGTLSIMVGGSREVFARIEPLLRTMGTDVSHCGGIGTGQVVKLMNNMLVFENVSALAEAVAIGTRAGVDAERLLDVLARGSADSFVLRRHGSYMPKGNYPDDMFPTTYSLKDLRYALALAEEVGVDAKGAKVVEQRFLEAIDRGLGHLYSPVIYKLFEQG